MVWKKALQQLEPHFPHLSDKGGSLLLYLGFVRGLEHRPLAFGSLAPSRRSPGLLQSGSLTCEGGTITANELIQKVTLLKF